MKKNLYNLVNKKPHNHSHVIKNNIMPQYSSSLVMTSNSRILFVCEDITNELALELNAMLIYLDTQDSSSITLNISSNGGRADAMVSILDTISIINSPVRTINLAKCYSAAAIILANGAPGERFCMENSEVMLHSLQLGYPHLGEDLKNSQNYFNFVDKYNDNIIKLLSKRTNKKFEEVKEDLKNDLFMNAFDACKYGIVDQVV